MVLLVPVPYVQVYGTNPMSFAWPRWGEEEMEKQENTEETEEKEEEGSGQNDCSMKRLPLVWDQASSCMARGEIQILERDGGQLPGPSVCVSLRN